MLGRGLALIFPIDWPEPFGLAMIEAMATGTPVVTYDAGSVREIVVDGETGFIRGRVSDMVTSLQSVPSLDRAACRARVEQFFSATAMADGYERIYRQVAGIPEELPIDLLLSGTFETRWRRDSVLKVLAIPVVGQGPVPCVVSELDLLRFIPNTRNTASSRAGFLPPSSSMFRVEARRRCRAPKGL